MIGQQNRLKKLVTAGSSVTCVTLTVLLASLDMLVMFMAVAFLCSSLGSLALYDRKSGRGLYCKTQGIPDSHLGSRAGPGGGSGPGHMCAEQKGH